MPELSKKSQSLDLYYHWYDWAKKYSSPTYDFLLGARDGWFGNQEEAWVRELQRRLGIVIDGVFGDRTASKVGYAWKGSVAPPIVKSRRKIWYFSFPGSGANFNEGPACQVGDHCKNVLNINHQPVYFQKGGYLGALGGDPKFSFVEVTWDLYLSIKWLLENNQDVQEAMRLVAEGKSVNDIELELEFGAYSQSEVGIEDALEMLFGDGKFIHPGDPSQTPSEPGPFRAIRGCINFIHAFGNPSKENTGIDRRKRPEWLRKKIVNFNNPGDFYAEVPPGEKIRPTFYKAIIKAEMELPFFVQCIRIAVPIIMKWATSFIPWVAPFLGGFGPLVQNAMGMVGGLQGVAGSGLMSNFMGQADSGIDKETTEEIQKMLAPTGLLENIPALIGLIAALPGLQAHGDFAPLVPKAIVHVNNYRRLENRAA